ncbi:MAG TPA: DUF6273 domain-containing protein [Levilinea sp.]|nr:DUF6273 domain-containing protein [Levilinea sp.]
MKKICILAAVSVLFAIVFVLSWCPESAERFTDSTGVEWRVLTEDADGNKLIITEHAHGVTGRDGETVAYNSTNNYTRLGESDMLRPALNIWFTNILAPELKEIALPAENVDNDVRFEPGGTEWQSENSLEGLTRAGDGIALPENALFVLSISEVNQYFTNSTNNITLKITNRVLRRPNRELRGTDVARSWWLRSPSGNPAYPIAYVSVDTEAFIFNLSADEPIWFRPALWIRNHTYE